MTEVFFGQRSIFSIQRYLIAGAVLFWACLTSLPAHGQPVPKAVVALDAPTQLSPLAPTLTTPTVALLYARSFGVDKGSIPLVSITPAPKAAITITPTIVFDPGELADITLTSSFSGKTFTYTFTNVPLDKDNNFTVDLTPPAAPPPAPTPRETQITNFQLGLLTTILAKLPVNNDPRPAIVWSYPVKVQVTRILKDVVTPSDDVKKAKTDADAAQAKVKAAVDALSKSSTDADAGLKAASDLVAAAKTPEEKTAADLALKNATEVKAGIDLAKPILAQAQNDADAAAKKADAAALAKPPQPFDPASKQDDRKKDKPQYTTTTLKFILQE
jgi:hypothetical protein